MESVLATIDVFIKPLTPPTRPPLGLSPPSGSSLRLRFSLASKHGEHTELWFTSVWVCPQDHGRLVFFRGVGMYERYADASLHARQKQNKRPFLLNGEIGGATSRCWGRPCCFHAVASVANELDGMVSNKATDARTHARTHAHTQCGVRMIPKPEHGLNGFTSGNLGDEIGCVVTIRVHTLADTRSVF